MSMIRKSLGIALAAVAAGAAAYVLLTRTPRPGNGNGAAGRTRNISPRHARRIAEELTGGEVVDIELQWEDDVEVYEIAVLVGGLLEEVVIRARDGRVLDSEHGEDDIDEVGGWGAR
jgi:hypothetical protein